MGVLPRAPGEGGWDDIMQSLERATAGVSDMTGGGESGRSGGI